MDILTSQYRNKSIFRLNLGDRQLMIDNNDIDLLGDRQGHLHLSNNLVKISSSFTQEKSSSNLKLTQHISRPKTDVMDPEDDRFQESDENDN